MNSMNKILSTVILLGFILLCGCNTTAVSHPFGRIVA